MAWEGQQAVEQGSPTEKVELEGGKHCNSTHLRYEMEKMIQASGVEL